MGYEYVKGSSAFKDAERFLLFSTPVLVAERFLAISNSDEPSLYSSLRKLNRTVRNSEFKVKGNSYVLYRKQQINFTYARYTGT